MVSAGASNEQVEDGKAATVRTACGLEGLSKEGNEPIMWE